MIHHPLRNRSWRKLVTALGFGVAAYLVAGGPLAASQLSCFAAAGFDSPQSSMPAGKDLSQWRKLKRRMSKDDVKKLLGEPERVSVSRFFESWYYGAGSVTFDGKGKVDFWSEP